MGRFLSRYFKKSRFSQAGRLLPKWLECDELEVAAMQLERLQSVWQDAVANIPYYAEMVKRGEAPANITSFAMFSETIHISTRMALKPQVLVVEAIGDLPVEVQQRRKHGFVLPFA